MIYNEVITIGEKYLLASISQLYGLYGYRIKLIPAHDGGRNVIYTCEKENSGTKILRISFRDDRCREDYLSETEYVRYLFNNGGSVSNVINSLNGNLLEEICYNNHTFFICLFEKAKGKMLVENNYKYRDNAPITEYYYNCGKVLGKLHQLSKKYMPVHHRYSFFDRFNKNYIDELIPDTLTLLKVKMKELIETLGSFDRNSETYGMLHFDYNDGNYSIDFENGQITVYDFDNSCLGFYMYDLADVWTHGVGWIQFEPNAEKRRKFMEDYFETILTGYLSETEIDGVMLARLPIFINATIMENIVDAFEIMRYNREEYEYDEELAYLIRCMEEDIPYKGFYSEIYSCEVPFEL